MTSRPSLGSEGSRLPKEFPTRPPARKPCLAGEKTVPDAPRPREELQGLPDATPTYCLPRKMEGGENRNWSHLYLSEYFLRTRSLILGNPRAQMPLIDLLRSRDSPRVAAGSDTTATGWGRGGAKSQRER